MKNAVVVAGTLLSLATAAYADDDAAPAAGAARTTTASTLVVVTPNAPIVVTNGQAQASQAPGAAENPPAPAPAAGAQQAPMTNNWNDVSHINGTVVPYGEHNTFLNAYKKVNISADPIAMMFGYYQVAGSYAVSQNVVLSLQFSGWSLKNGDSGTEFAVSAPIFLKRAYSGPFVEPGLIVHTDNNNSNDCYDCYSDTSTMGNSYVGPEMLVGWSWLFDSGLNMSVAVGASKRLDSGNGDPDPAGYFRVGYAF